MALSVTSSPNELNPVRNPIFLELLTDNYITSPGDYSSWFFSVSGSPTVGEDITFTWNEDSVTFIVVSGTPDNSGTQIPSTVSDATGYVDYLKKNYKLSAVYKIIKLTTSTFAIVAKEYGAEFDFDPSPSGLTGLTMTGMVPGAARVVRSDFKVFAELYVETTPGSNDFELAIAQELDVDDLGSAVFRVETILQSYFTALEPLPTYNQTTISVYSKTLRRFFFRYAERYGGTTYAVSTSATYCAINGGVYFNQHPTDPSQLVNAESIFLTWRPQETVTKTQPSYLTVLLFEPSYPSFKVFLNVIFSDGTTASTLKFTQAVSTTIPHSMYLIPAGYTQLNVASVNPAKTPVSYSIHVEDNASNIIVNARTFNISHRTISEEKAFLFKNTFGATESITFKGGRGESMELDVVDTITPEPYNYVGSSVPAVKNRVVREISLTRSLFSGMLQKKEAMYMKEVLSNGLIYLQESNSATNYIPLRPKPKSIKIIDGYEDYMMIAFEAEEAYYAKGYNNHDT